MRTDEGAVAGSLIGGYCDPRLPESSRGFRGSHVLRGGARRLAKARMQQDILIRSWKPQRVLTKS